MESFGSFRNVTPDDAPDWYTDLATDAGELLRPSDAREQLGRMYLQWQSIHRERSALASSFTERRQRHFDNWLSAHPECLSQVACQPRTNALSKPTVTVGPLENAGPEGWLLEFCKVNRMDALGRPVQEETAIIAHTWVPPELSCTNEPDDSFPLPRSDRQLILQEQYVILSAIHDFCFPERSFKPWQIKAGAEADADECADIKYAELVRLAAGLPSEKNAERRYRKLLQADLEDVRIDLANWMTARTGTLVGDAPQTAHSPDFRSLYWYGESYSFTVNQAPIVKVLYENWESKTPDVGDQTLLLAVDHASPPPRLDTLFRGNPAWGKLIVAAGSRGSHRLAEPGQEKA